MLMVILVVFEDSYIIVHITNEEAVEICHLSRRVYISDICDATVCTFKVIKRSCYQVGDIKRNMVRKSQQ